MFKRDLSACREACYSTATKI